MKLSKRLERLFAGRRLKAAFAAVKTDMEMIEEKQAAMAQASNDWIAFLDNENKDLKLRVRDLENKLDRLEDTVDMQKVAPLQEICE